MSSDPSCPNTEKLQQWLQGRLPDAEATALDAHVEHCAECTSAAAHMEDRDGSTASDADAAEEASPSAEIDVAAFMQACKALGAPSTIDSDHTVGAGEPDDARPLPEVPGYTILGVIDRGGMGVVYRAQHLALKRLVALKMILAGAHAGQREHARFRAEAEAVARLQHPNIVQIFEIGEHAGLPYLALELVDGTSLAAALAGVPQPAGAAAQHVETLAGAVAYSHQQGIVHRDLKPGNILLPIADCRLPNEKTEAKSALCTLHSAIPKITDFGLAKNLAATVEQTASGAIMGTPSYMAPEQASGRNQDVGPLADVYALGTILYECLTGRPPFRAASQSETIQQVIREEPVPPRQLVSTVPRDLETICLKCLHKEPRRRYASAAELRADLERYRKGEPIRARPVAAWERAFRWARRRPAVAALIGVALIAVCTVIAVLWFDDQRIRVANAALQEANDEALAQARRADLARLAQQLTDGDVAAEAGRLHLARTIYTDALTDENLGEGRRMDVRLKRLRAALFLNDRPFVEAELKAIGELPEADAFESRIGFEAAFHHLQQGMIEASRTMAAWKATGNPHEDKAIAMLQRARDDERIDPADRATARGVLAPTAKQALAHYRAALRLRPHHPYASGYYFWTCMLGGDMAEALRRAELWTAATPDDPLPWFERALVLALLNRSAEADEALAQLRKASGAGRRLQPATIATCGRVVQLATVFARTLPVIPVDDGKRAFALFGAIAKFAKENRDAPPFELFNMPLAPQQRIAVGRLMAASTQVFFATEKTFKELAALRESGWIAAGTVEFVEAVMLLRRPRPAGIDAVIRWQTEGADKFQAAAEHPAWWDHVPSCRVCVAVHKLDLAQHLAKQANEKSREQSEQLAADGRSLLLLVAAQPDLPKEMRDTVLHFARKYGQQELVPQLEHLMNSQRRPAVRQP